MPMLSVRVCMPPTLADAAQRAYVTPSQRALLDALPAWQTGATVLEETPADWGAAIEAPVRLLRARGGPARASAFAWLRLPCAC